MTDFVLAQSEKSLRRITDEHHEIHDGVHFHVSIVDETMADGDVIILAFKTPNTVKYVHMLTIFSAKVAGHVDLLEAGSWTHAQTSTVNIRNDNRNAGNTSGILNDFAQTAFNAGSLLGGSLAALQSLSSTTNIWQDYIMAAGASRGGIRRGTDEVILKQNTTYVIRFTADGSSNGGFVALEWYEHRITD